MPEELVWLSDKEPGFVGLEVVDAVEDE